MVHEKDIIFKFIGKNHLDILFNLLFGDMDLDFNNAQFLTTEESSVDVATFRPDLVVEIGDKIFMVEFESSFVGITNKKRFISYISLYDYQVNDSDKDIIFCVLSVKQKSQIVDHRWNDLNTIKIPIISLSDAIDKDEVIDTIKTKIKLNEEVSDEEVIKLAVTPLIFQGHEEIINQFYKTVELLDQIEFLDERLRQSALGIVLLLSNLYFEKDDSLIKELDRDIMMKFDCFREILNDEFSEGKKEGKIEGKSEGKIESAISLLDDGKYSLNQIIKLLNLSDEDCKKLKEIM